MKNLIFLLLSIIFSSCSTQYYQLFELESSDINLNGEAYSENNDLKVTYDFWANGGSTQLILENRSKNTIYIKHDECQFILNNYAADYYDNAVYTNSKSFSKSVSKGNSKQLLVQKIVGASSTTGSSKSRSDIFDNGLMAPGGIGYVNTSGVSSSTTNSAASSMSAAISKQITSSLAFSNSSSVSSTAKLILVIPPKSKKILRGFRVNSSRIKHCDLLAKPRRIKSKDDNSISFSKELSPFKLRFYITYSFDEEFNSKLVYQSEAYVSKISNMPSDLFIDEVQYLECETDNFPIYLNVTKYFSPLNFYKPY
mgnify:FL=1